MRHSPLAKSARSGARPKYFLTYNAKGVPPALVAALALGLILNVAVAKFGAESINNMPALAKLPMSLIGAAGALGLFALWPAMIWHCLVENKVAMAKKVGWTLLLLLTIPVGTLIYYFLVFACETSHSPPGNRFGRAETQECLFES